MQKDQPYVGVDVSKAQLDVEVDAGVGFSQPNTQAGYRRLLARLPANACVICEASGGYERGLLRALAAASVPAVRVNAKRVRDFARAKGLWAKTDRLDAGVLRAYGLAFRPQPVAAAPGYQALLRALVERRDQLVAMRHMESCRLAMSEAADLRRSHRGLITSLEHQIRRIETALAALQQRETELAQRVSRLTRFQGVGTTTALAVVAHLPELGALGRKEVAALAGVAPFNHDSGKMRGQRQIAGGRFALRRHLYMAALVAAHHNPVLRVFYQRLRAQGKAPKVAIVAVMRKLLLALNLAIKQPQFIPA